MIDPFTRTCFHPEWNLEAWYPEGTLDVFVSSFMAHYIAFEESISEKPFNRFTDFSKLTSIPLDLKDVAEIVAVRREFYGNVPPVKSAVLAASESTHQVAKMFAELIKPSPIEVRAFRNVEEAAEWLEVPVEVLLPEE